MFSSSPRSKGPEPLAHGQQILICWRSVFAGVLITIMSYMILSALGAGVAGLLAENAVENEAGGSALATGAGLWMGISAVISLFMGAYFTLRVSKFVTNRVGAAHGFLVASLFFALLIGGLGKTLGGVSSGMMKVASSLGSGSADLASNPQVQDLVRTTLGNSKLKSDPKEVAQGLAVRLVQGDTASAKSYLAYEIGSTDAEVDAKLTQAETEFKRIAKQAGEKTARAVADAGWSLFVIFVVGLLAALIGGRVGAQANADRPLATSHDGPLVTTTSARNGAGASLHNQRGSAIPYIFGWLLGVPVSLLLMIALLRSIF